MRTVVDLDALTLWGSDCTSCGNTTPGSMICDLCNTNADTVGLWLRTDDFAGLDADADDDPEPVHGWFGLTYANYLVLPRSILQSMPQRWQARFVRLLRQLQAAAWDVPQAHRYTVACRDESGRFVADPVPHYNRGRTRVELNDANPG